MRKAPSHRLPACVLVRDDVTAMNRTLRHPAARRRAPRVGATSPAPPPAGSGEPHLDRELSAPQPSSRTEAVAFEAETARDVERHPHWLREHVWRATRRLRNSVAE